MKSLGQPASRPEAPGQFPSHYAPATRLLLIEDPLSFAVPRNKKVWAARLAFRAGADQFAEEPTAKFRIRICARPPQIYSAIFANSINSISI